MLKFTRNGWFSNFNDKAAKALANLNVYSASFVTDKNQGRGNNLTFPVLIPSNSKELKIKQKVVAFPIATSLLKVSVVLFYEPATIFLRPPLCNPLYICQ